MHGTTPFLDIRDILSKTIRIKGLKYEIAFKGTGNDIMDDLLRGCLQRNTAKRLTMKQMEIHPFLQDCASLDANDLLRQVKSRVCNLQMLERVSAVPISQHEVLQELE